MLILNAVGSTNTYALLTIIELSVREDGYNVVITDDVYLDIALSISGVKSIYTNTLASIVLLSSLQDETKTIFLITDCNNIIGPTWQDLIENNTVLCIDS